MKLFRLSLLLSLGLLLFGAGCASIDVSSGGSSDRVLNGVVTCGAGLPAGTEVVVRLVSAPGAPDQVPAPNNDLTANTRPVMPAMDRILGESTQVLKAATNDPVPFQIPFTADDSTLRRGLNLDVRVSVNGHIRYRTVNAHVVTLASSAYKQDVAVQAVGR